MEDLAAAALVAASAEAEEAASVAAASAEDTEVLTDITDLDLCPFSALGAPIITAAVALADFSAC